MKIRNAERGDLAAIQAIYNESVVNSTASYDLEPQPLEVRAGWFIAHERDGYPIFVAEDDDGKVVGWASLSAFKTRPAYQYTAEDSVYIAAGHRGKGIGKLLLVAVLSAAAQRGVHVVMALIDSESVASVRLHTSLGFEEVGRLKEVGRKFDRWLDVIYMQKTLS